MSADEYADEAAVIAGIINTMPTDDITKVLANIWPRVLATRNSAPAHRDA